MVEFKRMSALGIFFLLLYLVFMILSAKSVSAQKFNLGLNFNVVSPQGAFRDNIGRNGYGFSFESLYKPGRLPIRFGLQLGFSRYGREERTEPFSSTIPDVRVEVETTNNIFSTHGMVRLQKELGRLSLYFDGLVGLQYLFTETSVKDEYHLGDGSIASTTNLDDVVLSYGAGPGVMFSLYTFKKRSSKRGKNCELLLDINIRYLKGGKAEYLKKGSIIRDNGNISYDVYTSEIDMLYYQTGIVIRF